MEKDRRKTDVIFRKWKENGEIIALFPHEYWDDDKKECASYMHIGQHSGADYRFVLNKTVPATREEYKELYDELTQRGYNLQVFMDDDMQKVCKEQFGCDGQNVTDLCIAFRDMEYRNYDTCRILTFSSILNKLGNYKYLSHLYRATYHHSSVSSYKERGNEVEVSFLNMGWGK
jgi:hypothetical protein